MCLQLQLYFKEYKSNPEDVDSKIYDDAIGASRVSKSLQVLYMPVILTFYVRERELWKPRKWLFSYTYVNVYDCFYANCRFAFKMRKHYFLKYHFKLLYARMKNIYNEHTFS